MRARRVGLLCLSLVMSGFAAVVGGTASAAGDESGTLLPLPGFFDIVADSVHDQEFVTAGDWNDDSVVVTDADGHVTRVLQGLAGASGMTLSPDSSKLYVALGRAHEIAEIDTVTFAERMLTVPADQCPVRVAVADDLVWYSEGCWEFDQEGDNGALGAVDFATSGVHPDVVSPFGTDPIVSTPVAQPGRLYIGGDSDLGRIDVTGGENPTAQFAASYPRQPGDIALTPDGKGIVTSDGLEYDAGTMRQVDSYPRATLDRQGFRHSVAISLHGLVGVESSDTAANILVYPRGQTVAPRKIQLEDGDADVRIPDSSMAFGGSRLYAITNTEPGHEVRLHVFDEGELQPGVPLNSHRLPMFGFQKIVAVPSRHRAFAIGGPIDNGVAVLGERGVVRRVLQHLPGPADMVLDSSGSTLFVALHEGDAVAAINTKTLRVRTFDTGKSSCPETLAFAEGLVWFQTDCRYYIDGQHDYIGAIDPARGVVHPDVYHGDRGSLLMSAPTHRHTIYLNDYPGRLAVSGGPHPSAHPEPGLFLSFRTTDAAATPDGLNLSAVSDDTNIRVEQATRNLALTGTSVFPDQQPVALAIRSDGLTATGLYRGYPFGVMVGTSPLGTPSIKISLPRGVLPRGLAFGSRDLYEVTDMPTSNYVRVLRMPRVRLLNLTSDSALHVAGDRVTVAAHVTGTKASKRTVSIYARRLGARHRTLIRRGRPGKYGNVLAHLRTAKTTRFSAVVTGRGSPTRSAVTVSPGVRFRDRISDAAGKTTDTGNMPMGSRPRLSTRVEPAHPGQCVSFHLFTSDPWRQGPNDVSSGCRRLDRHGRASWVVPKDMSFGEFQLRVEWRGDRFNQADTGPWHEIEFPCDRPGVTPPDCE